MWKIVHKMLYQHVNTSFLPSRVLNTQNTVNEPICKPKRVKYSLQQNIHTYKEQRERANIIIKIVNAPRLLRTVRILICATIFLIQLFMNTYIHSFIRLRTTCYIQHTKRGKVENAAASKNSLRSIAVCRI